MREAANQIVETFEKDRWSANITAHIVGDIKRNGIATLYLKHPKARQQIYIRLLVDKDEHGQDIVTADSKAVPGKPMEICKTDSSYRLEMRVGDQAINLNEHIGLTNFTDRCASAFQIIVGQEIAQERRKQLQKIRKLRDKMRKAAVGDILGALQGPGKNIMASAKASGKETGAVETGLQKPELE